MQTRSSVTKHLLSTAVLAVSLMSASARAAGVTPLNVNVDVAQILAQLGNGVAWLAQAHGAGVQA